MTKKEYITLLRRALRDGGLGRKEADAVAADYTEYFDSGVLEGKTEEELCADFGEPRELAREILQGRPAEAKPEIKLNKTVFKKLLLTLDFALILAFGYLCVTEVWHSFLFAIAAPMFIILLLHARGNEKRTDIIYKITLIPALLLTILLPVLLGMNDFSYRWRIVSLFLLLCCAPPLLFYVWTALRGRDFYGLVKRNQKLLRILSLIPVLLGAVSWIYNKGWIVYSRISLKSDTFFILYGTPADYLLGPSAAGNLDLVQFGLVSCLLWVLMNAICMADYSKALGLFAVFGVLASAHFVLLILNDMSRPEVVRRLMTLAMIPMCIGVILTLAAHTAYKRFFSKKTGGGA